MLKAGRVRKAVRALLGPKDPKQGDTPHQTHPEAYYKHVYLSEKIYKGMEFAAKVARTSKTLMANELMERGLRPSG
jgi:hypothetical protein